MAFASLEASVNEFNLPVLWCKRAVLLKCTHASRQHRFNWIWVENDLLNVVIRSLPLNVLRDPCSALSSFSSERARVLWTWCSARAVRASAGDGPLRFQTGVWKQNQLDWRSLSVSSPGGESAERMLLTESPCRTSLRIGSFTPPPYLLKLRDAHLFCMDEINMAINLTDWQVHGPMSYCLYLAEFYKQEDFFIFF